MLSSDTLLTNVTPVSSLHDCHLIVLCCCKDCFSWLNQSLNSYSQLSLSDLCCLDHWVATFVRDAYFG